MTDRQPTFPVSERDLAATSIVVLLPRNTLSKGLFQLVTRSCHELAKRLNQNLVCTRVPATDQAVTIHKHEHELVRRADFVIADISGEDSHVLFFLGIALTQGIPSLVICRAGHFNPMPIDIEVLAYEPSRLVEVVQNGLAGMWRRPDADFEAAEVQREDRVPHLRRGGVFICYSHADRRFLDRLLVHLRPLEHMGKVDLWADHRLLAGDEWRKEIVEAINAARVAVLLVSADFLASDFILRNELPPLLLAAQENGTRIIPIIVGHSSFRRNKSLEKFHALNGPEKPMNSMSISEQEAIFEQLADQIDRAFG